MYVHMYFKHAIKSEQQQHGDIKNDDTYILTLDFNIVTKAEMMVCVRVCANTNTWLCVSCV